MNRCVRSTVLWGFNSSELSIIRVIYGICGYTDIGMNSRQNIIERLPVIKPALQQEFPLRRTLFGSSARNDQIESSDVDILLEVDTSIGLRFVTLAQRLDSLLEQHVDLVSSRAVKPNLLKQIQAELIDV
jgi:uncharacterized protein